MNNYSASVNELWDGVSHDEEIKNEEKYTSDEMKEIKKLLFYSKKMMNIVTKTTESILICWKKMDGIWMIQNMVLMVGVN